MSIRKLIPLAGLVLAIAALAPASALAKKGGTDRPVKGKVSGGAVFCPSGEAVANHSGVATHFGKLTFHAEGSFTPTGPISFFGEGTASLVAANGDELTMTWTDEAVIKFDESGEGIGHIGMIVLTITGGTGRFADASGTINSVQDGLGLFYDEEGCTHDFNEETWTGHISY
jgi:hypothetical protein